MAFIETPADRIRNGKTALEQHGLDGQRLLKLAHRIANDAQRKAPSGLGGKYEDLVSFLALRALEAAVNYDPTRSGPNYTFASYLCDVMERRVGDFYRRKSEGFGDRRYGNDARVTLAGDTIEDIDTDIDFDQLVSERRQARWHKAANQHGLPIEEWIVITLDLAATAAERQAA